MRWLPAGVCLLLAGVCLAADTPVAAPSLCSNSGGAPVCHGPKKDLKAARQAFALGLQLEKSQSDNLENLDQAFYEFEEASRLVPQNVEYLTAREITRQHLAGLHLERGNSDLLAGRQVEALAEFRTALNLDPKNEFAEQRISDALGPAPVHTASPPQVVASADALTVKPIDGRHDIHSRGDSRGLVTAQPTLFEFKFVSLSAASSTIAVRGPKAPLEAATRFLEQLNSPRPEVMLDLKVFQVSHSYARNIGLHIPDVFNLFNIPAAALAAVGGQNIQDLINQLIASGGINQAGSQSISALLAQLQGQQNSIFSQPLATFGGGLTFMGLSLDQLSAAFSMNESSVRQLDHVQLRASQEKDATFKLGSRYPILNASFSPISNSAAISHVIGNQSFVAPFPSVNYEDIGLNIKARPLVHGNSDVALDLEIQFRTLGAASVNGIPVIANREYKGGILLEE